MTAYIVSSGQTLPATALNSGDSEEVGSGGSAFSTTVNSGGSAFLYFGGSATDTTVNSGGYQEITGGVDYGATVNGGGAQIVDASYVFMSGHARIVGGVASGTTVNSGGSLLVNTNGQADSAVVNSGGGVEVVAGGATTGTIIGSGGAEVVLSGGTAVGTAVSSGGYLVVVPGAVQSDTTGAIISTGVVLVRALAGATLLGSQARDIVVSGDPWPGSGGALGPGVGGYVPNPTLLVMAGGTAIGTEVDSGAELDVFSAATASATTVLSSAQFNVFSGGSAFATTLNGGEVDVSGGGTMSDTVVNLGAVYVWSGGAADDTTANDGYLSIMSGGSALNATVNNGGTAVLGGAATGTMVNNGGAAFVDGTASDTTIRSGGFVGVFGTASGTAVGNGGTLAVIYGGSDVATTVSSGGVEQVSSGGVAYSATVNSGGAQVVSSGGTASATTADSGGYIVVAPGGVLSGTTGAVVSAGVVLVQGNSGVANLGGSAGDIIVGGNAGPGGASGNGTLYVLPGGAVSGVQVQPGGHAYVYDGGAAEDLVLGAGAAADLGSAAVVGGGIVFAGSDATLHLVGLANSGLPTATISGFVASDTIEIDWSVDGFETAKLLTGNELQVSNLSRTLDLQLDPRAHYASASFDVARTDGSGLISDWGIDITTDAACFGAGTLILTDRGEVPVEALRIGDPVVLARGGAAPVRWLGYRRVNCRRHPKPDNVWPVRIAVDAFGAGQPRRELRLSPDHAVFVDGALIPIRYLLNGATIAQPPADSASYWHVELPEHAVLLAEGLPAESYLDTGNRAAFANGGGAAMLHPEFARSVWAARGCAPLVLAGPALLEARRRLLACAVMLGHALDPDPALSVIAGGARLPVAVDGAVRRVRVPDAVEELRLVSRTWVPAHTGVDEPDGRTLGIAVSRIWLDGRAASLDSPALRAGWHPAEPGLRWTDGSATIAVRGVRELAFDVAMTGRYWRSPVRPRRSAA